MDQDYITESIAMFEELIKKLLKQNVEFAKEGRQDQIIEVNKLIEACQTSITNLSFFLRI